MEAFNDWFDHFHKGQPVRPVLGEGASFTEKVAHEQRERVYQGEMERWRGGQVSAMNPTIFHIDLYLFDLLRLSKVDRLKKESELCSRFLEAGW